MEYSKLPVKKKILLGVTGSVAAIKVPLLVERLFASNHVRSLELLSHVWKPMSMVRLS